MPNIALLFSKNNKTKNAVERYNLQNETTDNVKALIANVITLQCSTDDFEITRVKDVKNELKNESSSGVVAISPSLRDNLKTTSSKDAKKN